MNDKDPRGIADVGSVVGFAGYPTLLMVTIDSVDANEVTEQLASFEPNHTRDLQTGSRR